MARTRVYLDTGNMKKMMGDALETVCKTSANRINIDRELGKASQRLRKAFDSHPVSEEIDGGPYAANKSDTLGGYGNLFSFVGFEEGSNPLASIRSIIDSKVFQIRKVNGVFKRGNVVTMVLEGPTTEEIFDPSVTKMPWAEGRSWAKGIEQGISGLGFYLNTDYKRGNWRSGRGFQTDQKIDRKDGPSVPNGYKNVPYISQLIAKYTKEAVQSITSGGILK